MRVDSVTKRWIKNASDEHAVAKGCRMDLPRGEFVVDWFEKCLKLYEGETAGEPFKCMAWQRDFLIRLFGWVKPSERWGRKIRRFTQASIWIPKKNGKSPTLAALGLYLLCADGEMGQKVYFCAKDGQQAREIAGKHAIEMCMSSPELSAECSINRSLMQITHEETRSILKPISSSDSRSQKSKEGLNGSLLVDETHVVDREFMNRISRAGISRSEPLLIEVSTAGNDPESYGRERYNYGKQVESGQTLDDGLLFICHEAPADVSDADLGKNPAKFGRMANPAWGVTVGKEEFLDDYNRSKVSLTQLLDFKMYRLNVWQQSANPWLSAGDWQKNKLDYTADDLAGRTCFGGMDLAKSRDTTAIVLIFPEDDGTFKQLAYFWIPRDRAQALRDKVSYLQWADRGYIDLSDGDETDFPFVRQRINEIREKFDLRALAYDGTYAAMMMQQLRDEDGMEPAAQLPFKQTMMEYTAGTVAYENLLITGKLHHNGNCVLDWQAGNVKVKSDHNGNIRPIKQKSGDYKTVDGIVSGVMALSIALQDGIGEPVGAFYEHNEIEMS